MRQFCDNGGGILLEFLLGSAGLFGYLHRFRLLHRQVLSPFHADAVQTPIAAQDILVISSGDALISISSHGNDRRLAGMIEAMRFENAVRDTAGWLEFFFAVIISQGFVFPERGFEDTVLGIDSLMSAGLLIQGNDQKRRKRKIYRLEVLFLNPLK